MAPVVWELQRRAHIFQTLVIATAQHREMLDQMMRLVNIDADVDLKLMEFNQSPARVMQRALGAAGDVFHDLRPDVVLVQGDTTTVAAVSMAAFLNRIPLGHIEAGLRSFDRFNPFPEEINRRIASMVADWHFAPTEGARINLLKEGVHEEVVYVTGNTVVDTLLAMVDDRVPLQPPKLTQLDFVRRKVILVTAHRRESHGERLRQICCALWTLVKRNPDIEIVYPVHPNPNVECTVRALLDGHPRIHLIPPLGYQVMINLMSRCYLILTDSGGIQEEAPSLHKPVLVLREVTERPEAVNAGVARLVGTATETIVKETERLLQSGPDYEAMIRGENPYGDGKAAWRIVEILEQRLAPVNETYHLGRGSAAS
jgi:UDP-N-acetylglucosamine 2-epimerase (non-hydrolysing)